jgi:hypothetical protein
MNSAIAGLIGAGIGALAGVAGAFINQLMQARAPRARALQSKKEEAYSSTLRNLLRVRNRRSGVSAEFGEAVVRKEPTQALFDDMVEALFWASTLTIYCSDNLKGTVQNVSRDLNETIEDFVSGAFSPRENEAQMRFDALGGAAPYPRCETLAEKLSRCYETILASAREDIGGSYTA